MFVQNNRMVGHVLAVALLLLPFAAPTRSAEPEQAPLLVSGQDSYHTYRIPALIATQKGTLLAFCEGRKKGSGDSGAIDLLLKRGLDSGKTWQNTKLVWHDGNNTCGNPCPVVDANTGTRAGRRHLAAQHSQLPRQQPPAGRHEQGRRVDVVQAGRRCRPDRAVCQATLTRYPGSKGGLLFANPASKKREKLTVRLSRDKGKTWPISRVPRDGPAAYSCLAVLPDGNIGCLYERGNKSPYETIAFARFVPDWLTGAEE